MNISFTIYRNFDGITSTVKQVKLQYKIKVITIHIFSGDCLRIILIADPQILGEDHETFIARFDNDRHMLKNFDRAVSHVQPDLAIFLGDLMYNFMKIYKNLLTIFHSRDEGSIANEEKFERYFLRFKKVFKLSKNVKSIFIPGDNDIGGAEFETVKHVERFKKSFGNETLWSFKPNLDILNVNLITKEFPNSYNASIRHDKTRIIISHYPLLLNYKSIVDHFEPTIVFSAHRHESRESVMDRKSHIVSLFSPLNGLRTYDLPSLIERFKIIEISVPVCSYRMGTLTIGFAQAIFDGVQLSYSPLFTISRYYQLGLYLVLYLVVLISNLLKNNFSLKRKIVQFEN